MSWSMIQHEAHWAHAHESDQILFMTLASEFLESSAEFSDVNWLQTWKTYWREHKVLHVNGCTDIDLQTHLSNPQRVELFLCFLAAYRTWLSLFGEEIPAEVINAKTAVPDHLHFAAPCKVSDLLSFATKIELVLTGGNTESQGDSKVCGRLTT